MLPDWKGRTYCHILIGLVFLTTVLFARYLYVTDNLNFATLFTQAFQEPLRNPAFKVENYSKEDVIENKIYETRINFTWLAENPVYSKFNISEEKDKKRIHVLIVVSTAPRRIDRRLAIRDTWWTQCNKTNEVLPECIFMTDFLTPRDKYYSEIQKESEKYKDIYFQHVDGGITFGMRFLNHMVFAVSKYKFDYFLRIDDDYLFCLKNFLNELPLPMMERFHWGWVHCSPPNIVRPEESIILLSRDLIETFLLQDPQKILCHPWADQMIGEWSNTIDLKNIYRHDNRLHHHPPASNLISFENRYNLCNSYMGIHGSYPQEMRIFWNRRGEYKKPEGNLSSNSHICPIEQKFTWKEFGYIWNYEPKLCITNPKWDTSKQFVMDGSYSGREDENKNG